MGELTSREGRESSEDDAPNSSFCPHRLPCSSSEVMEPTAQVMLCAARATCTGRGMGEAQSFAQLTDFSPEMGKILTRSCLLL